MTPKQKFWLYFIAGTIVVAGVSPGQPWMFYSASGLVVAAVASGLAGY